MPFARFMELALYHPGGGYYERGRGNVGRGGDFYTSVSTGPLFGELLAFQLGEWLEPLADIRGPFLAWVKGFNSTINAFFALIPQIEP